jgi:Protein of unknown function (DUF2865)
VSRLGSLRIVVALALAMALFPVSVRAEGFLGMIFNLFGGGRPPAHESTPPPPSASAPADLPGMHAPPSIPSYGGPQVAYCVRTCDGRYFPLPKNAGGGNSIPAKICNAMCPTAETKIFSGSNIDSSVAQDGSRYPTLRNAYVYRERLVEGCTCTGADPGGNTPIDISSDPTLRPGDIVVTGNGPVIFKGSKNGKYQSGDFAPVTNTKLSGTMRDKVTGIKVERPGAAPIASPLGFVQQRPTKLPEPVPATAAAEGQSPAATAAQIFDFKDFDATPRPGMSAMGYNGQQ